MPLLLLSRTTGSAGRARRSTRGSPSVLSLLLSATCIFLPVLVSYRPLAARASREVLSSKQRTVPIHRRGASISCTQTSEATAAGQPEQEPEPPVQSIWTNEGSVPCRVRGRCLRAAARGTTRAAGSQRRPSDGAPLGGRLHSGPHKLGDVWARPHIDEHGWHVGHRI